MNRELAVLLQRLIHGRSTAALGTIHDGAAFVSMVPYAFSADLSFILHVSRLAAHTGDMLDHPNVSLLIVESDESSKQPQELARVTILGRAKKLEHGSEANANAQKAYLFKFPEAAPLFDFADFQIFLIKPHSARFIAGFGQAVTLTGEDFTTAVVNPDGT
jgi:putative heme iron utilization protein